MASKLWRLDTNSVLRFWRLDANSVLYLGLKSCGTQVPGHFRNINTTLWTLHLKFIKIRQTYMVIGL